MPDALPPDVPSPSAGDAARGGRRETFRPSDRVKARSEFRRIQERGRKIHTRCFVFAVLRRDDAGEGEGGRTRLGITVTKKVAPAVGRNRVKRVMREVFRRNRELFPAGCDVVAIAKSGAPALGYAEVLDEVRQMSRGLAARAGRPAGSGRHER